MEEVLPRQFGKYTLLRALASGGMASVFLALQRAVAGFEKLVVIKRILPELAKDRGFVEMLLAEARTAATLNHPNVVQTFDVGEVEGTFYIAMEHINGEDIRSIVKAMKRCAVTEFPLEHTLNIVLGVCAGLAYAHEKRGLDGESLNIVHRDISPQNVLITFSGDVKVVDFGIAKSNTQLGEKTSAGQLKGKVPYMSPEQARGIDIDHRSDIFAVGIVLFELTTGRRLFKAKSEYETLKLICERDYPRPSQVRPGYPLELEAIVMRALSKDPNVRYQSARDMQAELETFIRNEKIAVSAVSLSNWMKFLFEDKIAKQKEALQDVKHLADVIAAQVSDPGDMYASTGTGTPGASILSETEIGAYTSVRRRNSMIWGAIAMAGLAVGGVGLFFATRKPKTEIIEVEGQHREDAAKRGSIAITSDPEGVYVRVAGELQPGRTPSTIEKLPIGTQLEVKLSLDGYEDHTVTVELTEDDLDATIDAKLVKASGSFVFKVTPDTAKLTFDDKPWTGEGNKVEGLAAGKHKAVFNAPGYRAAVLNLVVEKGQTIEKDIMLVKADPSAPIGIGEPPPPPEPKGSGTLSVNSRGGFCTNVTAGGRSLGPTPTPPTTLPAGSVGITCTTGDGRKIRSGAVIKADGKSRVTISIPKK